MNLLIRADASVAMGTGHVMRCLALAQAWRDIGGNATFALAEATPSIRAKVAAEDCKVDTLHTAAGSPDDARQTVELAQKCKAEWVVVDGYQFGADYQASLKDAGRKVLVVDDYGHSAEYVAEVVLNQNLSASAELYLNRRPQTQLLLGPRFVLLRREFKAWRDYKREVAPACRRVLVTMGGSDPENLTSLTIAALGIAETPDLEVIAVIGGSNPHFAQLEQDYRGHTKIRFVSDVSNIGELMASADVAISAAGSTCWELAFLGVPMLLIDVAHNQMAVAKEMHRRGCAIHVGDRRVMPQEIARELKVLVSKHDLRMSLSRCSRELVDGKGSERVIEVLRGARCLRLRPVSVEDRRLLWDWANDPAVRAASFSTDAISWDTHVNWFREKVGDAKTLIFVAVNSEEAPIGQIRFELQPDGALLNLSLAKERRGCGFAVPLIDAGVSELFSKSDCQQVHAFVKPENAASIKAFEKAGFVRVNSTTIYNHAAFHFVRTRERSHTYGI